MYAPETKFQVADVNAHREDGDVFIGPDATGNFLILSPETFELLEIFKQGKTLQDACLAYGLEDFHELDAVLQVLSQKGIIATGPIASSRGLEKLRPEPFLLNRIAQVLFSPSALIAYLLLAITAIAICFYDAGAIPTKSALVFHSNRSLSLLGIAALSIVTVSIHECGHMLAARAVGVQSKFSLGNRLWILVAETDLSGLWTIPRRKRYIPLLAGMIVDCVSVSLLICAVEIVQIQRGHKPNWVQHVLLAVAFTYISRLIWQFFLFLRTDLYFVFATLTKCTNLMGYTQRYIRHVFARSKTPLLDDIPSHERRIVQHYAWFWLFGQVVAVASFLMISIPVSLRYISAGLKVLKDHSHESPWAVVDSTAAILMIVVPWAVGCVMWGKGLLQRRTWGS